MAEENFKKCLSIFDKQNEEAGTKNGSMSISSPSLIHRLAIAMRLK
jgi:hypothetical protein